MHKGKLMVIGLIVTMLATTALVAGFVGVYLSDQMAMHNDVIPDNQAVTLTYNTTDKVYPDAIPYQPGNVTIEQPMAFSIQMASKYDFYSVYMEIKIMGTNTLTNADATLYYWDDNLGNWQQIAFTEYEGNLESVTDLGVPGGFLLFEDFTSTEDFVIVYHTLGSYELTWRVYQ